MLGKFKYVSELDAFVALNEFSANLDAEVWLYKPFAAQVPELGTWALMLAGVGVVGLRRRQLRGRSA